MAGGLRRLQGADPEELGPDDLESFAEAAWWMARLDEAIDLRQRSYAGFSSAGQRLSAARVALALAWDNAGPGAHAVVHGWFANASRLLEGLPESVEHAYLALASRLHGTRRRWKPERKARRAVSSGFSSAPVRIRT